MCGRFGASEWRGVYAPCALNTRSNGINGGSIVDMPRPGEDQGVISEREATCPRCGRGMERGFLNAGKGPFRWVLHPRQNATIFGGDHVVKQHWFWGRHVVPAARCTDCHIGVF